MSKYRSCISASESFLLCRMAPSIWIKCSVGTRNDATEGISLKASQQQAAVLGCLFTTGLFDLPWGWSEPCRRVMCSFWTTDPQHFCICNGKHCGNERKWGLLGLVSGSTTNLCMTLGKSKSIPDLSLPSEKMGVVTLGSLCGLWDFTDVPSACWDKWVMALPIRRQPLLIPNILSTTPRVLRAQCCREL